jgi:DnaJ family protein C protein 13
MKAAKRVNFMDIVKLETLTDEEHIVLVYLNSRVMRLSLKDSLPFLLAVQRNMKVRGTVLAAIYTCICP